MDFNVQWDTRSAEMVATAAGGLTLATLSATLMAPLRARDLPRLRAAGPLGMLLARQSEVYGREQGMAELGRAHAGLPDDLLNIHWDPVACAVALGWSGVTIVERRLRTVLEDARLRFEPDADGRLIRVVTAVDGPAFSEAWVAAVNVAQSGVRRDRRPRPASS